MYKKSKKWPPINERVQWGFYYSKSTKFVLIFDLCMSLNPQSHLEHILVMEAFKAKNAYFLAILTEIFQSGDQLQVFDLIGM